jgi:hypothetical protein
MIGNDRNPFSEKDDHHAQFSKEGHFFSGVKTWVGFEITRLFLRPDVPMLWGIGMWLISLCLTNFAVFWNRREEVRIANPPSLKK